MEQKKPITHITAGVIIGAISIAYTIILYLMNLMTNKALGFVSYAILLVGLIIFVNLYGNANNNRLSFGNLFAYGFKTTAIVALMFIVFIVIWNVLFPEYKEKGFEMARQQMEDQGKLSESQIDQGLDIARRFFWVFAIGATVLFMAIIGAIGSLIGAAITKKRP